MYKGIIYCYTCVINNKKYIGQTMYEKTRRSAFFVSERYSTNKTAKKLNKFDAARKKYGIDNFVYEILEEFSSNDKKSVIEWMDDREIYFIALYNTYKTGYNSTKGGHKGWKGTNNSPRNTGKKMSKLTKEKCTFKGHHHTEENRKGISQRAKERYKDKTKHPMYGKHHSEESKRKNSESRKGKVMGKDNPNSKSVSCFTKEGDFVKTFDSVGEAIRWLNSEKGLNISPTQGSISRCCNGIYKSAHGYVWKYNINGQTSEQN